MVIEINKDIDRYQESVALGLTAKQLIFSVASVAVGGGLVLLLYKYVGLTIAAYVAIPAVAPIALGGFYSYNGMDFYEYMRRKFFYMFGNKTLTYISTEGELEIKEHEVQVTNTDKKKHGKTVVVPKDADSKQEEFEAMKKKTKKMLFGTIGVMVAGIAAVLAYKYFK